MAEEFETLGSRQTFKEFDTARVNNAPVEDTDVARKLELSAIDTVVALKQNITDNTLDTTDKTVPGAINEVHNQVDINTGNIQDNVDDITVNYNRISDLEDDTLARVKMIVARVDGDTVTSTNFPTLTADNYFIGVVALETPLYTITSATVTVEGTGAYFNSVEISGDTVQVNTKNSSGVGADVPFTIQITVEEII